MDLTAWGQFHKWFYFMQCAYPLHLTPNPYTTKSFSKVGCRAQKLGLGHTPVYEIDPWWLKITRVAHNNNTLMALDSVEVIAIKKK